MGNIQGIVMDRCRKQLPLMHTKQAMLDQRAMAVKKLLGILGTGALTGAGARGLMGFRDMFVDGPNIPRPATQLPQPIVLATPPGASLTDEERKRQKAAVAPPWLDRVSTALSKFIPKPTTTNPIANEWGMPAAAAAGVGGVYGGYKLVDWLLQKEKAKGEQNRVNAAEKDYDNALSSQYQAAMMAKNAEDALGICELADMYVAAKTALPNEKQASPSLLQLFPWFDNVYRNAAGGEDNWQAFKGAINTAMLGTALTTGVGAYNWTKGKNKQQLLEQALRRRQQQRQALSPAPVLAMTAPEKDDAYAA